MTSQRFNKFMDWIFYAALTFAASRVVGSIDSINASVSELNVKMGIVVEKTSNHELQLQKQDDRLRKLEILNGKEYL